MRKRSRQISLILAIALIFSSFQLQFLGGGIAYADGEPEITDISLIATTTVDGTQSLKYQIYGKNFSNPTFWIDGRTVDSDGYEIVDGAYLIISTSDNNDFFESGTHVFEVQNSDGTESVTDLDFTVKIAPWVTSISESKIYIGESLTIYGTGIDDEITEVIIGGNSYEYTDDGDDTNDEFEIYEDEQKIVIPEAKSAQVPREGDVKLVKENDEGYEIIGVYKGAISVVGKLEGVEVESVVPNTGSVDGGTSIRILGEDGSSEFRSDMKIYIDEVDEDNLFSDIELITDESDDSIIGISGTTPGSPTDSQGVFTIIITDNTGSNELEIENAFTYEDKDNLLTLSSVTPPYGKGVDDDETVEIIGRNMITLNISNLSEWTVNDEVYTDGSYYDYDSNAFIIQYEGKYGEGSGDDDYNVDITREIKLILGMTTEITEYEYAVAQDSVTAKVPSVTEAGAVSVTMQTSTYVTYKDSGEYVYSRDEEYTLSNGFTFLSATTIPEIDSIEPSRGPIDELIYLTIKGSNFQVLAETDDEDNIITEYPIINIGNKIIDPNTRDVDDIDAGYKEGTNPDWIEVYDDEGNEVNGIGRLVGTVIKTAIPAHGSNDILGIVDVQITNPDLGESEYSDDLDKKFEFLSPDREDDEIPVITNIDPEIGPIEGGTEITIEGENFDYQELTPDVIVTIDGQAATVTSATATKIVATVPAGITIGDKPVQVITEDGAMATAEEGFTYIRQVSNPEIEDIAPSYGGKGTIVYIFGVDKGSDDPNFYAPDPDGSRIDEKIGTRVYLNGIDINDKEEYDDDGILVEGSVYYKIDDEIADPGDGDVFESDSRVEIIDDNTIRIEMPGGYSPGLKDITIVNPDTSSVEVEDGFNYKIPPEDEEVVITSIDPDYGTHTGGMFVTIEGENFKDGAQVFFGGKEATDVTVGSNRDKISLRTPAYELPDPDLEPSKEVEVTVVNYNGSSATSSPEYDEGEYIGGGYTYMVPESEPVIDEVTPSEGTTIGNEYVSLIGSDFRKYFDSDTDSYVYPKVYFGEEEVDDVIYIDDTELYVETPFYDDEGSVDITVINPDAGTYVKINGFTYSMTEPVIEEVLPDRGNKSGGQEIIIKGKDILAGDFSDEIEGESLEGDDPKINVLAIFGDEYDTDKVVLDQAEIELEDITIDYDGERSEVELEEGSTTASVLIYHEDIETPIAYYDLDPDERHLFILEWEDILGEELGAEAVLVELRDDELKATRRIAPEAEVMDATDEDGTKTLVVLTPPASYIGEKNLYIENKDGGSSSTTFEYLNPSSDPVIKSISPSSSIVNAEDEDEIIKYYVESTIEGGLYITIDGYDLDQDVEVFIDGTSATLVSRSVLNEEDAEGRLRTRVVVKSPAGDTDDLNEELRILIVNGDGGFVDASDTSKIVTESDDEEAKPYYFVYRIPESSPYIDSILPTQTSQNGGNEVRIVGYDFRTGATVIIGGVQCSIEFIDNDEIVIVTPTDLTPGLKDVQIINSDHGSITKTGAIKVVSYPEITAVTTEGGQDVEWISIEGGYKIVLLGQNFDYGARVYFGGTRKSIGVSDSADAKGLYADDNYYQIVDSYQAEEVEYVSENQLIVTVPEVFDEGDYTITILNDDGGLSDNSESIDYRVPIPTSPVNLEAEIVNDKYIRIYGYSSSNVSYYEIYTYLGDDDPDEEDYEYLDTTNRTSYKITEFKDFDDDEDIYLKIRAVNKYGPSEWSNEVKISYRELDDIDEIGEEDEDGDLVSDYQEDASREGVNVVLGNDGLRGSDYNVYVIDLKDKKYEDIDTRIINVPGEIIQESSRTILVDNGETRLQFNPRNFYVYSFYNMSSSDQEDTYGRLTFKKLEGSEADGLEKKVSRKYKLKSKIYQVKAELQSGRNVVNVDSTSGNMDLEISYDEDLLMGMDESKLQLYKYDPGEGEWIALPGGVDKENNNVYARIDGPGHYAILGEK